MANNNIITMDSLKEQAVRCYKGMIAVFPQFSKEEAIDISGYSLKFNGCYATNNSTVCFVSNNEIFVIPYSHLTIQSLHAAGLCEENFYVPFSNGDYPKFEKDRWVSLRKKVCQSNKEELAKACILYCDEHGIGAISQETLQNCFEIPDTGVEVKNHYFGGQSYYPYITTTIDCPIDDRIGHFCTNNGKVVFIYQNGKTYVAKGYKILDELSCAGYTESDLFVPFSNNEQIQNPDLKARWESITQ